VLAVAWMLTLGHVAVAEPESVRIDYVAPPAGCPDETFFVRSLRERTTRFTQAAPDQRVRRFLVRVSAVASTFSGRIEIRSPDGSTAVRTVEGSICDEVASALALITALAIDPNALTSSAKPEAKSPGEATSEPAGDLDRQQYPRAGSATSSPLSTPSPSQPWRWSAGLQGHMTFGVTPSLGYGGAIFLDAEAPPSSRFGPAVRVGMLLSQSDLDLPTGAGARFDWAVVAVEGCPVRMAGVGLGWAVYSCLSFHLGVLRAEGRNMSQTRETYGAWSDAGPVLRLRLAATDRLMIEAQAAFMVPLTRPTFGVLDVASQTTSSAYSVPFFGGSAGIGAAYRFR
jgi:hypothetical protein